MTNDPVEPEARIVAVCDACVLYSITMADLLTSLGETGLFHPRWTNEIHNEWIRTIPAEFRREHDLERDSTLALIQVGDSLILAPIDGVLTQITERMEAAMRGDGVTVEALMEETLAARAEIVREEFGEGI